MHWEVKDPEVAPRFYSASQVKGIIEVYEPFLIKEGFLKRTPRGREVTELAYRHLGRTREPEQGLLF